MAVPHQYRHVAVVPVHHHHRPVAAAQACQRVTVLQATVLRHRLQVHATIPCLAVHPNHVHHQLRQFHPHNHHHVPVQAIHPPPVFSSSSSNSPISSSQSSSS